MVLHKGDRDAGSVMIVLTEKGGNARVFERIPQLDGSREWQSILTQATENNGEFSEFLERRGRQDPDLWIIELDVADGERFIAACS